MLNTRVGGIVDDTEAAQPQPLGCWSSNFTGIMTDRNDNDLQLHAFLTAIYATLPTDLSLNSDKLAKAPKW